ncbi:MAG TPA: hypothetical protein VID50_09420, partial [Candidatus Eisenbacteria bacterium]
MATETAAGPARDIATPLLREVPAGLTPLRALSAVEHSAGTVFLDTAGPHVDEREWVFLAFDPLWYLTLAGAGL